MTDDEQRLRARARIALGRLGLDDTRFELAVSIFGPDSDEARGALLGLVREAAVDPKCSVSWGFRRWLVWSPVHRVVLATGATELEALVAALENAGPQP